MFWFICLLGVAFVFAVILKIIAPKELENYSSLGLALRLILFLIGFGVILFMLALYFHW
jgi:hypothetical protein